MMNILSNLWHKVAPDWILLLLRFLFAPKNYKTSRKTVLNFYRNSDLKNEPKEVIEGIKFLKFHKFTAFPFKWALKYETLLPEILHDHSKNRFFINYGNKKLYYPRRFSKNQAIWGTRSILKEQDPQSPHLYLTDQFQLEPGTIVIDAGVAEGNFALSVVEKAKKLYLIECEPEWIETLKITFEPWKDKVVFIEKYLSGINDKKYTTIDDLIQADPNEKYFIKMDIEGYEKEALRGMEKLVSIGKNIKMDICTYHHINDLDDIGAIISSYGFNWHASDGYILYFQPNEEPKFRKALIRAQKSAS